jgi:hypothetical protein
VIRHIAVVVTKNSLDLWNVADCRQAFVSLNSVEDIVNDFDGVDLVLSSSGRF